MITPPEPSAKSSASPFSAAKKTTKALISLVGIETQIERIWRMNADHFSQKALKNTERNGTKRI